MLSPSYKTHSRNRHPTWPTPVQVLAETNHLSGPQQAPRSLFKQPSPRLSPSLPNISEDEDPFSHFLSPILDEESYTTSSEYAAGILPYSSPIRPDHESLLRARLEEKWETFVARRLLQHKQSDPASIAAPLPLPFPQPSSSPPPEEDCLPDLFLEEEGDLPSTPDEGPASPASTSFNGGMQWYFTSTVPDDMDLDYQSTDEDEELAYSVDGWEADRRRTATQAHRRQTASMLSPRSVLVESRQRSRRRRSLGAGKAHAWREPSWDLYTVDEEEDLERMEEDGRGRARGGKGSKTVTWNEMVEVLQYER